MLDKLKAIGEGWKRYAFENPETEIMAQQRALVCSGCEHSKYSAFAVLIDTKHEEQTGMVCDVCDCPLSRKTRSKSEICPLNKW